MNIKIKKYTLVICMCVCGSIVLATIYGSCVKKSYNDDTDFYKYINNQSLEVMYYYYPFDKNYDIYGEGDIISKFSDLENFSDVIIRGTLDYSAKRDIYVECILTQVQVQECYKGNLSKNDKIKIFEPVNCTGIDNVMLCSEGYAPMTNDAQYILYLKQVKNSLFGENQYLYVPVSIKYGKYKMSKEDPKLFTINELDDVKTVKYNKIKDIEIFLFEESEHNKYIQFKKKTLENLCGLKD